MAARQVLALTAALGCVALMAVGPGVAVAADGPPVITNTETVNVKTDATGAVDVVRVYDQISVTGSGNASWVNPVSTDSLRNLDGFGSFTLDGDSISGSADVDGQYQQRSVSNFTEKLPVTISVTYLLNGAPISPSDLVGKSGDVEFRYRVENVTGEPQEITVTDGEGKPSTTTEVIFAPYAGSLDLTAPANFTDVKANGGGVVAGDGKGGSQMSFSLTLIPPLGDAVAEVGFSAKVTDAVVPPASLTVVPVVVSNNPTLSGAKDSFEGGAKTGAELTAGAVEIDTNLVKLSSGAGDLLSGLIQLSEGAQTLSDGLNETAIPGANELADGATQVADGSDEVADGADQVAGGSSELSSGASQLSGGLDQLASAVDDLPDTVSDQIVSNPDYQLLIGTLTKIIQGIGTPSDTSSSTIEGGLNQVKGGLRYPGPTDCDEALTGGTPNACGAMDAVELISDQLAAASAAAGPIAQLTAAARGAYQQAVSALPPTAGTPCPQSAATPLPPVVPPANLVSSGFNANDICVLLSNVTYGLGLPAGVLSATDPGGLRAQTSVAAQALVEVYEGVDAKLIPGITQIQRALYNQPCDPSVTNPGSPQYCGISQALSLVKQGIPQLVNALTVSIADTLASGIGSANPSTSCDPTATLTCASQAVAGGASQVSDGASQVSDGASQVSDGANQVADGNAELAAGLDDAGAGSTKIATGLGTAADAVPQIQDGAKRLSTEGTQKLIAAGNDTAVTFGGQYATLSASAERTADGALPYGAPTNATVKSAAYSYDVAGESGESSSNLVRGVLALVLGGAAVAGAIAVRRMG